ncbi:TrkA C-terminal domain-containing protein [Natronorubrum thiooxidans]|uniref:RCK C-terminal domain-containing protein n=1 Tax=Natronorubrum thiooxidans TaxID=308853 RepID=A0A1N7FL93_9EURY|nr:TrkA C-terminal domain-containing protein [Natronorubrum thiooxidans]SIS01142.1 hypothetical protein SAMN05421752_107105 [Natronorubrum thiooxidans]
MGDAIPTLAVEVQQMATLATLDLTLEWTRVATLGIPGYGLLAGLVTTVLAFGYRARTAQNLARGPAIIAGLAVPLVWLCIELWQDGVIVADSPLAHYTTGIYLLGVVATGAILSTGGHRLGDHLACGVFGVSGLDASGPIADRIRLAGIAVVLTLPETIDDADGYPPIDDDSKRRLEGRTVLLPQELSPAERRSRLRRRLEDDFGIGYVATEFAADGTITSLTVGAQPTGLSARLPPDRVAVAVRAAFPPRVSTGDPVEVWTTDSDSSRLVATGTFRSSSGSVATLIVDEDDAAVFTLETRYRLTVHQELPSDGSELAAAIRAADETITLATVVSNGPLESEFVGWVPGTVLAIERGECVITRPEDGEPLQAGDTLYVFGTPEILCRLRHRMHTDPTVSDI